MKVKRLDTSLVGGDFRELSYQLLHKPNYLPDCLKDIKVFTDMFSHMVNVSGHFMGVYGGPDGDKLGGFWFLGDIVPAHEATFFAWFWDRSCYTPLVVRTIRSYIRDYVSEFGLVRIVARTPDNDCYGRMLEHIGFKLEGRFKNAWKGGGKLSTLFQFRILVGR
jgi:RimJ/RimL family protein N-acetyltransferase